MSTNFYAHVSTPAEVFNYQNETETNEPANSELVFHIGKTVNGGAFTIVQGMHFSTSHMWKMFLLHNQNRITIRDEYGHIRYANNSTEHKTVDTFITEKFTIPDNTQEDYLRKNNMHIGNKTSGTMGAYWVDEGFLFYNGVFI